MSPPPPSPRQPQRRGGHGQESLGELGANAGLEIVKALGLLAAALGRTLAFAGRDTWRWGYLAALVAVGVAAMLAGPADRPIVAGAGAGALFLVVFVRYATVSRGLRSFREQVTNVAAAAFGVPAENTPSPKIRRWGRPGGPVIVLHVPATFDSSRRGVFQRLVQDRVAAREVVAWAFAWRLDRNEVTISPTTPLPEQVRLDAERAPQGLALFLGIGHDADGQPTEVMWDPDVADPHALVGGRTKTGKSVTLRALISQALAGGWQVILADPKGVDYRWARGLAGVTHCGGDESPAAVAAAHAEMERRQAWLEKHAPTTATDLLTVEGQPFVPCLVIADEVAELASIGDKDQRAATVGHLGSLARRSRFVGMVCAFATQRPDVSILPGEVRALALDTPIATPSGWQTMGSLRIGDEVFDERGEPCRVIGTTETMQDRPCYRLTFSDGSTLVADETHRWLAFDQGARAMPRYLSTRSHIPALSRGERWPNQAALLATIAAARETAPPDDDVLSVPEFERELGGERITLLRALAHKGEVRHVAQRPGESGRFPSKLYRRNDVLDALHKRLTAPAPAKSRTRKPRIVTTAEMAESLHRSDGGLNWSIRVADPLVLRDADLPIDPWLLGYWLGDGNRTCAQITTADDEVIERIERLGYTVVPYGGLYQYGIKPGLKVALRDLGVLGDKHVPDAYMRASAQQRRDLLAGLLDSDGTGTRGQIAFVNTNRRLAEAVFELAASLGHLPTIHHSPARVESHTSSVCFGASCKPSWRVTFTPREQVFGIPRKQTRLHPGTRPTLGHRYITAIEPIDSVAVRCIEVDAPSGLYLAGRAFITTHNSNLGTRVLTGDGDQHMRTMVLEGTDLPPLSAQVRGRGRVKIGGARPREVQFAFIEPQAVVSAATARAPATAPTPSSSSAEVPEFTGTLHEPGPATPPDSGDQPKPPPDDEDGGRPRLRIVP